MRLAHLALFAALVAIITACGGGGSTSTPEGTVLGTVVSRDGSTADLSGVGVLSVMEGATATTDHAGQFQLRVRAGLRVRLRFEDPAAPRGSFGMEDIEEGDDDTPDGADIDGDEVEIDPLDDGETCEVEVEIEGGEIVECWVKRKREGPEQRGEGRLRPPECEAECTARGEIEMACAKGCCRVEVEVAGLEGPNVLDIVLVSEGGDEVLLGAIDVESDGSGHFVMEACAEGGELPFAVNDVAGLAGVKVLLIDAGGNVVLKGTLPGDGPQHDDGDKCHGTSKLLPPDGSPEKAAKGVAAVKCGEDCCTLVIEVWGFFSSYDALKVVAELPEQDDVVLGTMEVGEKGTGRFAADTCIDDVLDAFPDLPDVPRPGEGPGKSEGPPELPPDLPLPKLKLVDAEGRVVLAGPFPFPMEGPCGGGHPGDKEPPPPPPQPAAAKLLPPEGADEPDAKGALLVKCFPECEVLVIEVGFFDSTHVLDILVETEEGSEVVLGEMEVGEKGIGRFAAELCSAEDFPEGIDSLADLAGQAVFLVEEGDVLLQGEMPELDCPDPENEEKGETGEK